MESYFYKEKLANFKLSKAIAELLPENNTRDIVIVCIGTDRSTGDSLGPLVGNDLEKLRQFHVYGTLHETVHAVNLKETLKRIHKKHKNPFIIAVDASLGGMKNIGNINVKNGPIRPGAGVGKDLGEVGDISITGIVNIGGFMNSLILQNTPLNRVIDMSKVISSALYRSVGLNQRQELITK